MAQQGGGRRCPATSTATATMTWRWQRRVGLAVGSGRDVTRRWVVLHPEQHQHSFALPAREPATILSGTEKTEDFVSRSGHTQNRAHPRTASACAAVNVVYGRQLVLFFGPGTTPAARRSAVEGGPPCISNVVLLCSRSWLSPPSRSAFRAPARRPRRREPAADRPLAREARRARQARRAAQERRAPREPPATPARRAPRERPVAPARPGAAGTTGAAGAAGRGGTTGAAGSAGGAGGNAAGRGGATGGSAAGTAGTRRRRRGARR